MNDSRGQECNVYGFIIFVRGNRSECSNYSGISIQSMLGKMRESFDHRISRKNVREGDG